MNVTILWDILFFVQELLFIRIYNLRFFTNILWTKRKAETLKRMSNFLCWKFLKYNTLICFFLDRIRFFLSLNGRPTKKATKTSQDVCSMLIISLQVILCVISGLNSCRLALNFLITLRHQNRNIKEYSQEYFEPKIRKIKIFNLGRKKNNILMKGCNDHVCVRRVENVSTNEIPLKG